ncbi:MAG: hypothetical protein ACOY3P_05000 [Planctomycetota bacterium]
MKALPSWLGAFCIVLTVGAVAVGQSTSSDFERRKRELKAAHERRVAEMKAEHERRVAEMNRSRGQSGTQSPAAPPRTPAASTPKASNLPAKRKQPPLPSKPSAPPFNAAAAPPPEKCLMAFVEAARKATAIQQLFNYMPLGEQRTLKECQANYDPSLVAEKRDWFRKQDPKIDEESLAHLTNSPYANALIRQKRIAAKILQVLSVKIEGNKATIRVSTTSGGTVNGVEYPYGTATIEMIGEAGYWRIDSYNDGNIVYLDPPQPK